MTAMGRFAMAAAAIMAVLPGMGQEHWRSGFTVGVSGEFTAGHTEMWRDYSYLDFKGFTVSGGYKWYVVKGLFVKPELAFYYEDHEFDNPLFLGGPTPTERRISHSTEVGIGVAAIAGYTIPLSRMVSLDLMTGLRYSYGIDQHATTETGLHYIGLYDRSSLRWRFGLGLNVWRMSVAVSYDLGMLTMHEKNMYYPASEKREKNVVSVGLGYKF